jgi:hypothetical protein
MIHLRDAGVDWRISLKNALAIGLLLLTISSIAASPVEGPRTLSRLLPSHGLYCYIENDGLDSHADAWKATAAFNVLGQSGAGAILRNVIRQSLDTLLKGAPDAKIDGSDLVGLPEYVLQHGAAFAFYREDDNTSSVMVFKDFGGKGNGEHSVHFERFVLHATGSAKLPAPTHLRGRAVYKLGDPADADQKPVARNGDDRALAFERIVAAGRAASMPARVTWWLEGNDLVVVWAPSDFLRQSHEAKLTAKQASRVAAVLDAIDGKERSVSSHPTFLAASAEGRDIAGFEPTGLSFAEAAQPRNGIIELMLPSTSVALHGSLEQMMLETTGLDRARQVIARWGFRGKSLVTDVRFVASEPWRGMAGLLDPSWPSNAYPCPTAAIS